MSYEEGWTEQSLKSLFCKTLFRHHKALNIQPHAIHDQSKIEKAKLFRWKCSRILVVRHRDENIVSITFFVNAIQKMRELTFCYFLLCFVSTCLIYIHLLDAGDRERVG